MKKVCLLSLFQILFIYMQCIAQKNSVADLYLTNYSITNQSDLVGYVKCNGADVNSIAIGGEHAAAFKISKNNQLLVRPDKLKPGIDWFDIALTVKTSNGKLSRQFRIVKDEFIRNKVIAHRGAWKNTGAPENSIAALKPAVVGSPSTLTIEGKSSLSRRPVEKTMAS